MFPRTRIVLLRAPALRLYSTQPPVQPQTSSPVSKPSELTPTQQKISARERAELVSSSIKNVFEGILSNEENFEPIDTKPIMASPRKYVELSQFHRDQVQEELEKRMRQNWNKLTPDHKRTAYFISYGNWGVREGFKDNMFANVQPEDLPFTTPSQIRTSTPGPKDPVKRLPEVDLMQCNEKRREDFKKMTRRLDPMSKFVVYFAAVISLLALYRDKYVGDDSLEVIPESPLMLAELQRQKEQDELELKKKLEEEEKKKPKSNKWYYLWLK